METMNDRIAACIEASGLTKSAFAEKINVGQPFISQLCAGKKNPSDRTITDICREFNIDEVWLRTGTGEMHRPISRDEQIAKFSASILKTEDDSFKRRFLSMLSRLDEADWVVLEKMALSMVEDKKKD